MLLSRSLNFKITVSIVTITFLVISCIMTLEYAGVKKLMTDEIRSSAHMETGLIYMGIEKPMIVGDNKGTADEFSKIKSKFGHITAYMNTPLQQKCCCKNDTLQPHKASETRAWNLGYAAAITALGVVWWLVYSVIQPAAHWLVVGLMGFAPGSPIAESVEFFFYDTAKILLLLVALIYAIAWARAGLNVERVRDYLSGKAKGVGYFLGSAFGAVTPFCSCSSIPLFLGFTTASIPMTRRSPLCFAGAAFGKKRKDQSKYLPSILIVALPPNSTLPAVSFSLTTLDAVFSAFCSIETALPSHREFLSI